MIRFRRFIQERRGIYSHTDNINGFGNGRDSARALPFIRSHFGSPGTARGQPVPERVGALVAAEGEAMPGPAS